MDRLRSIPLIFAILAGFAAPVRAQFLLVPMDTDQSDHLRAYGLTFWTIQQGLTAEWLLNYRDGAFLLADQEEVRREAGVRGVTTEPISTIDLAQIRAIIEDSNMESVVLERAPKIAVYTPGNANPWDDAVTLALDYADIPYEKIWDRRFCRAD